MGCCVLRTGALFTYSGAAVHSKLKPWLIKQFSLQPLNLFRMTWFYSMLFVSAACVVFVSCSSKAEDEFETIPAATIRFSSPTLGAIYTNGDSVTISAVAISTANVHGYDLAIQRAGDATASLYFTHIHSHNDTLHIHEKWKAEVATPTDLEVEITLYLDHAGHTKKGKQGFRVQ